MNGQFTLTDLYNASSELTIGVYDKKKSASKELAIEGAVRSAGTFYHTGEEPVNRKDVWRTFDKR